MPRLLIATTNPGKIAELRGLLDGCGWDVVTPDELGITIDVEEIGETYHDNARIKAGEGARLSGLVTLADDSGIEIQALDGGPGVRSARYLGPDATYQERFAEIEKALAGLPDSERAARFVAVIAIADPHTGEVRFGEGSIAGVVSPRARGENGFGYDPIFWSVPQNATTAELPEHQKAIISHRARAIANARQILLELLHVYKDRDPTYTRTVR
jgi:XTP/dITP diphosphohydrolase